MVHGPGTTPRNVTAEWSACDSALGTVWLPSMVPYCPMSSSGRPGRTWSGGTGKVWHHAHPTLLNLGSFDCGPPDPSRKMGLVGSNIVRGSTPHILCTVSLGGVFGVVHIFGTKPLYHKHGTSSPCCVAFGTKYCVFTIAGFSDSANLGNVQNICKSVCVCPQCGQMSMVTGKLTVLFLVSDHMSPDSIVISKLARLCLSCFSR